MISAKGIKKYYGDLEVLKGVDLTVDKGEFVAIVGPSGAGKTTLLQIIGTLDFPDKGTLSIGDEEVNHNWDDQRISVFRNQRIGFIFQFHNLLAEFTALENVLIPASIHQTMNDDIKNRAIQLLSDLGLKDRINHKPNELSGGEQQRVAIARALINQPDLLLADEPTGNLDSNTAQEINILLKNISKDFNQTIITVTHNSKLAEMADRIVTMKDGLLV